jgi:hypothetical protein
MELKIYTLIAYKIGFSLSLGDFHCDSFSPLKSRKSALKSKAPTKCRSMPTLGRIGNEVIKKIGAFTLHSDVNVINDIVAQPLANILASGPSLNVDAAVENFLSNPELFGNFTQVLDEVWESDLAAKKSKTAMSTFGTLSTPPHQVDELVDAGNDFFLVGNSTPRSGGDQTIELSQKEYLDATEDRCLNDVEMSSIENISSQRFAGNDSRFDSNTSSGENNSIEGQAEVEPGDLCRKEMESNKTKGYAIKVLLPILDSSCDPGCQCFIIFFLCP